MESQEFKIVVMKVGLLQWNLVVNIKSWKKYNNF